MTNPNWKWRPLGELFAIGAGKTMSEAARTGSDKVPFLRTSNVFWDQIDLSDVDEMAISPAELAEKSLKPGDLLVCEGGEIGRAAIWDGQVSVMSFQNHLHRLRPLNEEADARFYVYFLQSAFTQLGIFAGAGNKTTIPNLSRNRLAALEVPFPPLGEQRAVADSLRAVRRALSLHSEASATADELKRATMRELFTRGLRGETQRETEIGMLPESWSVRRLGDACTLSTGTTPSTKREDYYRGTIPFIKTADIVNNRLRVASTHISEQARADYNLTLYPAGTVLMAMYGQGKTRGQVALLEVAAATTQNAAAIAPKESIIVPSFLWHYLLSRYDDLRGMGSLGHLSHLNLGYLREFLVPTPSLQEQHDISIVLNAIDDKINLHRRKSTMLEELFSSLLHKLMTGEIRASSLALSALTTTAPEAAA
ncbi:restriction endonuclease subunit S [Myxococcus hansupus]|nr:restriction endonuclease subunit S [Myxococcus hansupus]